MRRVPCRATQRGSYVARSNKSPFCWLFRYETTGNHEKLKADREKATQDAAALTLTAKMIPVMIQTMDKFHAMGASPEHIVRFLQATIDEINSGRA